MAPEWRNKGIGGVIVRGLIARERGTLHLMCMAAMEGYYARFGFRRIRQAEMPAYFRRIQRAAWLIQLLSFGKWRLIVMGRDESKDRR